MGAASVMEVKSWFHLLLYAAVGFAATLVIMIVAAQVWYITPGEFAGALGQPDIRHAIGLSILTATAAESLGLVLAVPTAYVLSRSTFPGRAVLDAVLDIPIILSPLALGTALLLFFRTAPGLWIEQTLVHFVFEIPGIILAQFFLAFALSVRVMKAGFESIDIRCEQVARFLGCSAFQAFLHVSLPMVRRSLLAGFICPPAELLLLLSRSNNFCSHC